MELTDRYLRSLSVEARKVIKDESYRHGKPRKGLELIASTKGAHTFYYQRMIKRERYKFKLGVYPELTLAAARELVDDINDYDGTPEEARQALLEQEAAESEVLTVKRLINRYIEEECEPYNRQWKMQQTVLKRELKPFYSMPADQLTTENVHDLVQACLDRDSPRAAQEALKQVKSMYNWAMGKKRVRRQTVSKEAARHALVRSVIVHMAGNPADGVIAPTYAPRTHHLTGKALEGFLSHMRASTLRDDCKLILEIQLQTFARVGEVSEMTWDELDLSKRIWVVPAERYKTGRDHTVMLSKQTAKLLKARKKAQAGVYVFPMPRRDGKPVNAQDVGKEINKVRTAHRKRDGSVERKKGRSLKVDPDFSSHSLRHTGATWLASQHCPYEVRERLLGHVVDKQSDMSQRYQHHEFMDERKEWTQKWCDFLAKRKD